jgi:hypothetical protein
VQGQELAAPDLGLAVLSGSWSSGGPGLSIRDLGAGLAASNSWFSGGPVLSTRGPNAGGLGDGLVAALASRFLGGSGLTNNCQELHPASWFSDGPGLTKKLSGAGLAP